MENRRNVRSTSVVVLLILLTSEGNGLAIGVARESDTISNKNYHGYYIEKNPDANVRYFSEDPCGYTSNGALTQEGCVGATKVFNVQLMSANGLTARCPLSCESKVLKMVTRTDLHVKRAEDNHMVMWIELLSYLLGDFTLLFIIILTLVSQAESDNQALLDMEAQRLGYLNYKDILQQSNRNRVFHDLVTSRKSNLLACAESQASGIMGYQTAVNFFDKYKLTSADSQLASWRVVHTVMDTIDPDNEESEHEVKVKHLQMLAETLRKQDRNGAIRTIMAKCPDEAHTFFFLQAPRLSRPKPEDDKKTVRTKVLNRHLGLLPKDRSDRRVYVPVLGYVRYREAVAVYVTMIAWLAKSLFQVGRVASFRPVIPVLTICSKPGDTDPLLKNYSIYRNYCLHREDQLDGLGSHFLTFRDVASGNAEYVESYPDYCPFDCEEEGSEIEVASYDGTMNRWFGEAMNFYNSNAVVRYFNKGVISMKALPQNGSSYEDFYEWNGEEYQGRFFNSVSAGSSHDNLDNVWYWNRDLYEKPATTTTN